MKNNRMRSICLAAVALAVGLLSGCGGDDTKNTTTNEAQTNLDNILNYISGKVVDAISGKPIGSATVKVKVDGVWISTTTSAVEDHTKGDFLISGLPEQSTKWDLIVESPTGSTYATLYKSGDATNISMEGDDGAVQGINHGTYGRGDLGLLQLYPGVSTSLTMLNTSGAAITGLMLHWDAVSFYSSSGSGHIEIQGTENSATAGQYDFLLPKGMTATIYAAMAMDSNGVMYQFLTGDDVGNHGKLTELTAGYNEVMYLRPMASRDVTITFNVVDETGAALTTLGSGLIVTDPSSNNEYYAAQDTTTLSTYKFTAKKKKSYTWLVPSLDVDGDGLADYTSEIIHNGSLTDDLNSDSITIDENGNITYTVKLTAIDDNTAVSYETLATSLIPGTIGQAIIVFNRPVSLLGELNAWLSHENITTDSDERVAVSGTANVVSSTGVNVDDDSDTVNDTVSLNGSNQYAYVDFNNAAQTAAVPGIDSSGEIANSWTHDFGTEAAREAVKASLSSNNTVLTLSLESTELEALVANKDYNFHFAVKGISDGTILSDSVNLTATSSSAVTNSGIIVDDGDGGKNENRNLVTNTQTDLVADNEEFRVTLPNYNDSADRFAVAVTETQFATDADINFDLRTASPLSIILPTKMAGSIKILSYTETHLNDSSSAQTTTVTTLSGTDVISIDSAKTDQNNGDDYDEVLGVQMYSMRVPNNQYVKDVPSNVKFGFDLVNGWYYQIDISSYVSPSNGGYISAITLDLDLENSAGLALTGTSAFEVR